LPLHNCAAQAWCAPLSVLRVHAMLPTCKVKAAGSRACSACVHEVVARTACDTCVVLWHAPVSAWKTLSGLSTVQSIGSALPQSCIFIYSQQHAVSGLHSSTSPLSSQALSSPSGLRWTLRNGATAMYQDVLYNLDGAEGTAWSLQISHPFLFAPQTRATMTDVDVLVVGAGPTGLTLAGELLRFGLSARLIDQAETPPLDHSRALAVHARTLELFEQIGLAAKAQALGTYVEVRTASGAPNAARASPCMERCVSAAARRPGACAVRSSLLFGTKPGVGPGSSWGSAAGTRALRSQPAISGAAAEGGMAALNQHLHDWYVIITSSNIYPVSSQCCHVTVLSVPCHARCAPSPLRRPGRAPGLQRGDQPRPARRRAADRAARAGHALPHPALPATGRDRGPPARAPG